AGVLLLSVLGVSQAGAQLPKWEFSVNPGAAVPIGTTADFTKKSFSIDGQAFYKVHEYVQVGGELGYISGMKLGGVIPGRLVGDLDFDGINDPVAFTSDIDAEILHITPEIKVGTMIENANVTINPYLIAGGGFYQTHFTAGTVRLSGTTSGGF